MQTHINYISIHYNNESISLPVIHNGVDLEWIPELQEFLQYILDQFPENFLKTYHPSGYITTTEETGNVTHVMLFQLKYEETPLELTDTTKEEILELFYDPNFSGPDKPVLLRTPSSVIIINRGSY